MHIPCKTISIYIMLTYVEIAIIWGDADAIARCIKTIFPVLNLEGTPKVIYVYAWSEQVIVSPFS